MKYDVIVIGAGPGGYVAAIKAAKEGLRTAIIEEDRVGGTCLNRGCIPAKAMIHASSLYREMKHANEFGICAGDVTYDYGKVLSYKQEVTNNLCDGVERLLKSNGVDLIFGKGRLLEGKIVSVICREEERRYEAEHVILAAGSKPLILPIPGMDLPNVITSDQLFKMEQPPKSLVIIGGGVISVEFASVFSNLGCDVTIIEAMPRIVPNMDKEISQNLKMILKKRGVKIHTGASVQRVEQAEEGCTCVFLEKEKEVQVTAQYVLCAVGRGPNTNGLISEDLSIEMERGRFIVGDDFCTSIEGVYAIGDVIKGMQLAHLASGQAVYVAEKIAGKKPSIDLKSIPGCVYTDPEIGAVGLTEEQAKEQGIDVKVGKFIMSANGKSLITHEERGFIKIIARASDHVIIGAHFMCARATDMIGEMVTAIVNEMTVEQLLKGVCAHPTYHEGVAEALEEILGGAIHVMPKKKP